MSDVQTMQELITGLKAKKKNLRTDEAIFLKLSGINEEIEKANQDKSGYETELTEAKGRRDDAKAKKAAAVARTTFKIAKKMNQVLPYGGAVFSYDEDNDGKRLMKIGWSEGKEQNKYDGKSGFKTGLIPYNGLSGGEKQIFDTALANVLDANIIVLEAAELDGDNLQKTLLELSKLDKQVIVNCCHPVNEIPEPFKTIEV